MADKKQVVVWTRGPREQQWSKETFEDVGHRDLVRVELRWLVGSGPGHADMTLDNSISSEWNEVSKTVTDSHEFPGTGMPSEVEGDQAPVLLSSTLLSEGELSGTLYVDRRRRA
ncbi:hypothetical protein [uncultured Microbacterium sp.]|uniref:hypothetical protein n=1 Tax=uncultured Microbacterium sp. TaxID=191216 RepID=UPI0028DD15ED|nr:hypothetical protein [uncultured Microbacterium sp.]